MESKTTREPEESNLESMEHRVCQKITVFYICLLASLSILTQKYTSIVQFRNDFDSGSKFTNVEGAGRYQN